MLQNIVYSAFKVVYLSHYKERVHCVNQCERIVTQYIILKI
jgi:hypothetical protein